MNDVMRFAQGYRDLGHAVASQLDDVLGGESIEEQNPNAVDMIMGFLDSFADTRNEDILEIIDMFMDAVEEGYRY